MPISVWSKNVTLPKFDSLNGEIKTDVLIIGGGMCGLLCGYFLNQSGVDCVIAESKTIANGTTKNTTAKITSLHGLIYADLIDSVGIELAQMYFDANRDAVNKYRILSKKIDFDFKESSAYTYSLKDRDSLEAEVRAIEALGGNAVYEESLSLPFQTKGAVRLDGQAQFNPLKFIREISKNLKIYENTFIEKIDGNTAISKNGRITANKIIIATHFPFINKHGLYFLKLYQHRSYVIALKGAENPGGMYVDESDKGLSFRSYGDLLILGGGGHRTGKHGGNWEELRNFAKRYYPSATEEYFWSAQDCMSLDKIPYIGNYSSSTPNLFVATGFNKWGMTGSMVSANILCNMITKGKSEYEPVFNPSRSIMKSQLWVNGFETTVNMLTPTTLRCPHLGCALKWNKHEHSWDCPCHGSRFDENGNLIDNPATHGANI